MKKSVLLLLTICLTIIGCTPSTKSIEELQPDNQNELFDWDIEITTKLTYKTEKSDLFIFTVNLFGINHNSSYKSDIIWNKTKLNNFSSGYGTPFYFKQAKFTSRANSLSIVILPTYLENESKNPIIFNISVKKDGKKIFEKKVTKKEYEIDTFVLEF